MLIRFALIPQNL